MKVFFTVTFQLINNGGNETQKSSPAILEQQNHTKSCHWSLSASWFIQFKYLNSTGTIFVSVLKDLQEKGYLYWLFL